MTRPTVLGGGVHPRFPHHHTHCQWQKESFARALVLPNIFVVYPICQLTLACMSWRQIIDEHFGQSSEQRKKCYPPLTYLVPNCNGHNLRHPIKHKCHDKVEWQYPTVGRGAKQNHHLVEPSWPKQQMTDCTRCCQCVLDSPNFSKPPNKGECMDI